jgi:hypothetical protein
VQPQEGTPTPPERSVTVAPDRLAGWITGFEERHGRITASARGEQVIVVAADGAQAVITVPFPPLPVSDDPIAALRQHALAERRVGALLVRKGGHAAGVFAGRRLITSKVGSSYVQGRTKAGGWSQQRFSRRRGNQADKAYAAAADVAATVLLPAIDDLATVFLGGDRLAVTEVLSDSRLAPVRDKAGRAVLPVAEPRLAVLRAFPDQFLAVRIRLNHLA